jgi:uncharacterized tellurite resistance protein B-like protein
VGILAAVLAAMGVAIAVLIRLSMAADAAKGLAETAGDAQGLFRRWRWRRKLAVDQLAMVDDPRIAVAVMLVVAAQSDGALTATEQDYILGELRQTIGLSAKTADDVFAHARFIAKDVRDLDTCLRRLTALVQKSCGPSERADLVAMLTQIIALDHAPDPLDTQAVVRFAKVLQV